MPSGKNPFLRYHIINTCLTNKKKPYPTTEELIQAMAKHDIHIANRALANDLEAMRYDKRLGYFAPIAFCRSHYGYHYTDPEYTIDKLPLSSEEVEAFELIVESLRRFRGAQIGQQVEGIFDKLDKVVMPQLKTRKSRLSHPVVDFEKVPYAKGIEHFDALYRAIIKNQPINISYRKFDHTIPTKHLFHPYLLKEYKFRWYVVGHSEKRQGKNIFALDRIIKITPRKVPYRQYTGTDLQKYFEHTIGVTIGITGVKEVRLWCSPMQGHYLKTQHLHATQQIISEDRTGMVVSLQLIPNYELLQTLLAFGPEVEVLQPASLREQMIDMLTKSMQRYNLKGP